MQCVEIYQRHDAAVCLSYLSILYMPAYLSSSVSNVPALLALSCIAGSHGYNEYLDHWWK